MELGEKIRQARLEAGLSQRQLAGDRVTRNMLSQIETGAARPSMKTLGYFAEKLQKPISYFLEEEAFLSPNQGLMASARRLWDAGDAAQAALVLEGYQGPDPVFDRERDLLWVLAHLKLAEDAIREKREPYALSLLQKADTETAYCGEELNRKRLLLLGRLRGQQVSEQLPSLDGELLLRAGEALGKGKPQRGAQLLDAAEDQTSSQWALLRGMACYGMQEYAAAKEHLLRAEKDFPQAVSLLEGCYKELGDFRLAYEYACKQRERN